MNRKLLLTIMFSALVGLSLNAQWHPIGPGGGIVKCFATGGSNIFSGTGGGGVFLTSDNGVSWNAVNNGLTNLDVQALAVTGGGTTVFAGTYMGGVFLSTDAGANWIAVNSGLTNLQVTAIVIKGTTIFAGTNGGVFISNNNGGLWTAVNTGLSDIHVLCLAVSGTDILAGTLAGGVFLSANDGGAWVQKNSGLGDLYVNSLAVNGTKLYAGNNSGVYSSVTNGSSWTLSRSTSGLVKSININGSIIYASYGTMYSGGIDRSPDNGATWTTVTTGLNTAKAVYAVLQSGSTVFAGTDGPGLYTTANNGGLWVADAGITNTNANSLSLATVGTNVFAGVFGGGVYLSTSNGSGPWTTVNTGLPTTSIQALASDGSTTVFAGTYSNGVYKSVNNGGAWTAMNTGLPASSNVTSFAITGTTIYVGTFGGGVFKSTIGGSTWTPVNTGLTNNQVQSLVASGTKVFAGTYNGGVFYSSNSGGAWTAVNTGLANLNVNSLALSGPRIFAGTLGGVYSSVNNGGQWFARSTGMGNQVVMSLLINGSQIFAGTDGGGVFYSNDSANNWIAVNTGLTSLNDYSLAISGTDIFAGSHGGGVWKRPMADFNFAVTTQSVSASACAGVDTYFSVAATGTSITYQWQYSGGGGVFWNLFDNTEYSGVYTNTLTVLGAESSTKNGFVYRCVITSGTSVNSNDAILTINATPNQSVTDTATCLSGTIDITTSATFTDLNNTGGTVSYWTNAEATSSLATPTAISTSGTYYIKIISGGCSDIKPVLVIISAVPNLSVTNPAAVCSSSTIDITTTFTDLNSSTGTVSYWSDAGATVSVATPTAITTSGTYYIKKVVSGSCSDIKPVTVTINSGPNLSIIDPAAICSPNTINITNTFSDQNSTTGTVSYWSDAGATVSVTAPTSISIGGTYYIKKTSGSCSDIKPVVVTINSVPNLSVTNPAGVCIPSTVDITNTFTDLNSTSGTVSYWANAGATISLATPAAITAGGTYYIKKTSGGCSDIKPVSVIINLIPDLGVTNPPAVCFPNTVNITTLWIDLNSTTGTVSYWTDSAATIPVTLANAIAVSGTYYIKKVASGGCWDIISLKVIVRPLPVVSYTQSPAFVCIYDSALTLAGGSPVSGTFSGTGVTTNTFYPSTAGAGTWNIVYTYTDAYTCTNSATQSLVVDLCTGIQSVAGKKESGVTVFPNPFSASVSLTGLGTSADVSMFNILGAQVGSWKINTEKITLETGNLPAGIYLLQIKTEDGILVKKIIKE